MSPLAKAGKKRAPDLAIILGGGKHAPEDEDDEGGDEGDSGGAKKDAAEALIEAVHAKDAEGVVQAIGALHDLCSDDSGHDDEEGDE